METLGKREREGLKEMHRLAEATLSDDLIKTELETRIYLKRALEDDALLLRYLIGRKYRPQQAWETLKRRAEVEVDLYPEMFPSKYPPRLVILQDNHVCGILKGRDSQGRRIAYFNSARWDGNVLSLDDIFLYLRLFVDKLLQDNDAIRNGIILIKENSGSSIHQAKRYSPDVCRRLIQLSNAFPLRYIAFYAVNSPYFMRLIFGVVKPFIPAKLKSRIHFIQTSSTFEELHQIISSQVLPKSLGGVLEECDAFDSMGIDVRNWIH